jgi:K+-transporting ATPase ATPase A chain
MVDQVVTEQGPRPRSGGVADRYQNARHPTAVDISTPMPRFRSRTEYALELSQMLSIFAIGSGLTITIGRMTKNQGHGWSVWAVMMFVFLAGTLTPCWWAEAAGNPIHHQLGCCLG